MPEMHNPWLVGIGLTTMVLPSTLLFLSLNLLFPVPFVAGLACVVAGFLRITDSKRNVKAVFGTVLCLAAAAVPFAQRAYGERSGKPILFVLPDHFRGQFSIVKDSKRGINPRTDGDHWVFEIPPEGVLYIIDARPFHQWHSETAEYRNGTGVEVEGQGVVAAAASTESEGSTYRWRVVGPQ